MKEQNIQTKIIKYLQTIGYCRKVTGKAGLPDVIAFIDGKFYGFEIKKDKNSKPSPLQLYNIEEINKNGGSAHVVWTLKQVKDIICNR